MFLLKQQQNNAKKVQKTMKDGQNNDFLMGSNIMYPIWTSPSKGEGDGGSIIGQSGCGNNEKYDLYF